MLANTMQKSIWYHHKDATNLCFACTSIVDDKFTVSWETDELNSIATLIGGGKYYS
jgi:hypothetical protein